jgi:hypothetical protein
VSHHSAFLAVSTWSPPKMLCQNPLRGACISMNETVSHCRQSHSQHATMCKKPGGMLSSWPNC